MEAEATRDRCNCFAELVRGSEERSYLRQICVSLNFRLEGNKEGKEKVQSPEGFIAGGLTRDWKTCVYGPGAPCLGAGFGI